MRIGGRHVSKKRLTLYILGGGLAFLLLIQAVPYGRDHSNPPTTQEPKWSSAQIRAFAVDACFDCHSNETKWPWYTNVAPMSWLTESDVNGGRSALNFSEWDKPQDTSVDDIVNAVRGGLMPPWFYTIAPNHKNARLSKAEKEAFAAGLTATLAASPPRGGG